MIPWTPVLLIALTTALMLDALRRPGSLERPEFYLYVFMWGYGTCGYVAYLIIQAQTFRFMLTYDGATITQGYLYTTFALAAIYAGGGLYRARAFPVVVRRPVLAHVAVAAAMLGIGINFAFFYQQGLLSGTLQHTDVVEAKAAGFIFPYAALVITSLAMVAVYDRGPTSWAVFGAFAVLNLAAGSRRHVLLAMVAVFVGRRLCGVRFSKRWIATVLVFALTVGIVVGATRGGASVGELDQVRALRVFSEFFRPFGTLLHHIERSTAAELEGQSLLDGVKMLIPGPIAPFKRPVPLGEQFKTLIDSMGVYQGDRVPGYGFSPVTEIFLNFGVAGIPIFFFFFGLLLRGLSSLIVRNEWAFLNCYVCCAMFTVARGGFQNVMTFVFHAVALAFVMIALAQMVHAVRRVAPVARPTAGAGAA